MIVPTTDRAHPAPGDTNPSPTADPADTYPYLLRIEAARALAISRTALAARAAWARLNPGTVQPPSPAAPDHDTAWLTLATRHGARLHVRDARRPAPGARDAARWLYGHSAAITGTHHDLLTAATETNRRVLGEVPGRSGHVVVGTCTAPGHGPLPLHGDPAAPTQTCPVCHTTVHTTVLRAPMLAGFLAAAATIPTAAAILSAVYPESPIRARRVLDCANAGHYATPTPGPRGSARTWAVANVLAHHMWPCPETRRVGGGR